MLQSGLSYFCISTDLGQGSCFCQWPSNCSNTIYLEAILSPSNHFLIFVKNQLGMFALYMYSFSIKKILPYNVSWKIPFHSVLVDWIKLLLILYLVKISSVTEWTWSFLFKRLLVTFRRVSLVAQMVKNLSAMKETWLSSTPESGIPWSRKWQPLQYSCLENPMDRGAWWAIVHGLAKS